ncbi:MAG: PAS domain S-box protein [Planctomycetota bacterium]
MADTELDLTLILDQSLDEIYVFDADSLLFIYANRRALTNLGYSMDQLKRLTPIDIAPKFNLARFKQMLTPLRADREGNLVLKTLHHRKDGSRYPVEVHLNVIGSHGKPAICANVRDLTEKVAAEQERIRGQFFLDNSQDAVYWVKEDGRFVYANKAATRMLGHSREQLLQMRVVDIDPDYPPEVWKQWWEKMRVDRYNVVETEHHREDGSRLLTEVTVHFFEYAGEEYIVGVTRDISAKAKYILELGELNKELQQTNQELERFAWIASHDLQEPLRAISGFLQLLEQKNRNSLDEQSLGYIQKSVSGAIRMCSLINSLLSFTKASKQRADFSEDVNLRYIAETACTDLQNQIQESQADIIIGELPTVKGAYILLIQLFRNLISNAMKYSGDQKPKIEIGFQKECNKVFVKDSGIGIAPEYQSQIFELFKRLHRREEYPGTGLGLAICKQIADRHHWSIEIESELGQGSCFLLKLSE